MTGIEDILSYYVDANLVLLAAAAIWFLLRRTLLIDPAYRHHLSLLKSLMVVVLLSPLAAYLVLSAADVVFPNRGLSISDLAVAAYLRGDIAMDAVRFEALLDTRSQWTRQAVSLASPVWQGLFAVMAIGVLGFIVQFSRAALRIRRLVDESFLWKRSGRVDIRLSDRAAIPFATRGILRRYIVLPAGLIADEDARRMALAHELQHVRNGDLEWELLMELSRPLVFWNPAFVYLKREMNRLCELACDQAVMRNHGFDARNYAGLLLSFCDVAARSRTLGHLRVSLVRSSRRRTKMDLLQRLTALRAVRLGRSMRVRGALAVMIALVCIPAFATAIKPRAGWTYDTLMLSTVVNLQRLEARNMGYNAY